MLRLTANKTKLYTLVAGYVENLPPMRGGTIFVKYPRTPDYALDWITPEWNKAHAFFSTCMGRPLLPLQTRDDHTRHTVIRTVYNTRLQRHRTRRARLERDPAADARSLGRTVVY